MVPQPKPDAHFCDLKNALAWAAQNIDSSAVSSISSSFASVGVTDPSPVEIIRYDSGSSDSAYQIGSSWSSGIGASFIPYYSGKLAAVEVYLIGDTVPCNVTATIYDLDGYQLGSPQTATINDLNQLNDPSHPILINFDPAKNLSISVDEGFKVVITGSSSLCAATSYPTSKNVLYMNFINGGGTYIDPAPSIGPGQYFRLNPVIIQPGDATAPTSTITSPPNGDIIPPDGVNVTGTASDNTGHVKKVEISTDGGLSWYTATDLSTDNSWSSWSYLDTKTSPHTIISRATDFSGNVEVPKPGVTVTSSLNVTITDVSVANCPMVTATVEVYNKSGQNLKGLTSSNFKVKVDGNIVYPSSFQEIKNGKAIAFAMCYSPEMEDSAWSQEQNMESYANSLIGWMGSNDAGEIIKYCGDATVVQPFTTSKSSLWSAVSNYWSGCADCSGADTLAPWDAALQAVEDADNYVGTGISPAVVLMSDGWDSCSGSDFSFLTEVAMEAGIPIYVIGFQNTDGVFNQTDLENLATATGGQFYYYPNIQTVNNQIVNDIEPSSYQMSFYSPDNNPHKVEITCTSGSDVGGDISSFTCGIASEWDTDTTIQSATGDTITWTMSSVVVTPGSYIYLGGTYYYVASVSSGSGCESSVLMNCNQTTGNPLETYPTSINAPAGTKAYIYYHNPFGNGNCLDPAPRSNITNPANNAYITGPVLVEGTAWGYKGMKTAYFSANGGSSYNTAFGTTNWNYMWKPTQEGHDQLKPMALDNDGNYEGANTPNPTHYEYVFNCTYSAWPTVPAGFSSTRGDGFSVLIDGTVVYSYCYECSLQGTDVYTGGPPPYKMKATGDVHTITMRTTNYGGGANFLTGSAMPYRFNCNGQKEYPTSTTTTNGLVTGLTFPTSSLSPYDTSYNVVNVTVDLNPPVSTITKPGNGGAIYYLPYTITGTATDTSSGVQGEQISIDGGSWIPVTLNSGTWSYALALSDGSHTIAYYATDKAGHVEATHNATFTVDTTDKTAPTSTITSPVSGAYVGGGNTCTITGTASDTGDSGLQRVDVSTDGGNHWYAATGTASWSYTWTPLPSSGSYTIKSRAVDNATNTETQSPSISVTIDKTTPTSAITLPGAGADIGAVPNPYIITGTATDTGGAGLSGVDVSTDGGSTWKGPVDGVTDTSLNHNWTSWSYSWTLPANGSCTIKTRAVDNANNFEVVGTGRPVTVDKTLPSSTISSPAMGANLKGTSYTISGTASDNLSGISKVEVGITLSSWGGTNPTTWYTATGTTSWSYTWTLPADGSYAITSRAVDKATNTETPSSVSVVNVDNTPPTSTITFPPSSGYVGGSKLTITGEANDNVSGVSKVEVGITPNGGSTTWYTATGAYDWSYSWTLPASGTFTIKSRATDYAGNVETPVTSISVTIDKTKPIIAISKPAISANLQGITYTISGTASDTGSGVQKVEVMTDGKTWNRASGTPTWSNWSSTWVLPVKGKVTIKSKATDNVFNVSSSVRTVTVTAYGNPELEHYNWDAWTVSGGCNSCHTNLNAAGTPISYTNKFLSATSYRKKQTFCYSCHNAGGVAHDKAIYGLQHSTMVNVTTSLNGDRKPTYGNITAGETNNEMRSRLKNGKKVVCMTCHNTMKKSEDYGRVWENTSTTNYLTYRLVRKGWNIYGYLVPKVYRDVIKWLTSPTYTSMARKSYLVDPSQYTYNETSGLIKFTTAQSPSNYIYVTLDFPALRVSSQNSNICGDCHTQKTHKSNNCFVCHSAHENNNNQVDIRSNVRTPAHSGRPVIFKRYTGANSFADGDTTYDGICEVCHMQTKYYRNNGSVSNVHTSDGQDHSRQNCIICHSHNNGFGTTSNSQVMDISFGGYSSVFGGYSSAVFSPYSSVPGGNNAPPALDGYSI
jgi:hypothetical protein